MELVAARLDDLSDLEERDRLAQVGPAANNATAPLSPVDFETAYVAGGLESVA